MPLIIEASKTTVHESTKAKKHLVAHSKGRKLIELMRSSEYPSRPIPNFTPADIEKWGYKQTYYGMDDIIECYSDFLTSIGTDASSKLGSDADSPGSNFNLAFHHKYPYTINGKTYPKTGGSFSSILNPTAGLLIAVNNITPAAQVQRSWRYSKPKAGKIAPSPRVHQLPLLQHWSDIAFLQWSTLSTTNASLPPLKYILRANIQNKDTTDAMSHVLGYNAKVKPYRRDEPQRPRWPGVSFDTDTRAATALLGTPNGIGVGWLLAQHKRELGHKVVDKVVVFFTNCADWETPNLLFCLGDAGKEEKPP
jgi:hypothetical protein